MRKTKRCAQCAAKVEAWNKECWQCGFHLVLEPLDQYKARLLRRPALGALLFTQGWTLGARLYLWFVLSFIPIVGVVVLVVCVLFGRRLAWRQGGWASWEEFERRMRILDIFGFIWVFILAGIYVFAKWGQ